MNTSCSVQADVYQRLRLPVILMADCRLGGISATIAAYESLLQRGYDVAAIAGLETAGSPGSSQLEWGLEIAAAARNSEDLDNMAVIEQHVADSPCRPPPGVFTLPHCQPPPPPPPSQQSEKDGQAGAGSSDEVDKKVDRHLDKWLQEASPAVSALHEHLLAWHQQRRQRLEGLSSAARDAVWWPFTQHASVGAQDALVIDARSGECYTALAQPEATPGSITAGTAFEPSSSAHAAGSATAKRSVATGARASTSHDTPEATSEALEPLATDAKQQAPAPSSASDSPQAAASKSEAAEVVPQAQLEQLYDGCASWWTQGVNAELAPFVKQHMAYAAGRYGHVIFPEAAHEPAVRLSEMLLAGVGKGWAQRVFYSDDGCAVARLPEHVVLRSPVQVSSRCRVCVASQ